MVDEITYLDKRPPDDDDVGGLRIAERPGSPSPWRRRKSQEQDDRVKQDDYRMIMLKENTGERRAASRCKVKSRDDRVKQDDYRMEILKAMAAERRAASRINLKSKAQCDYAMKVDEYRKRVWLSGHNYPDMKELAPYIPPNKKAPLDEAGLGYGKIKAYRKRVRLGYAYPED